MGVRFLDGRPQRALAGHARVTDVVAQVDVASVGGRVDDVRTSSGTSGYYDRRRELRCVAVRIRSRGDDRVADTKGQARGS